MGWRKSNRYLRANLLRCRMVCGEVIKTYFLKIRNKNAIMGNRNRCREITSRTISYLSYHKRLWKYVLDFDIKISHIDFAFSKSTRNARNYSNGIIISTSLNKEMVSLHQGDIMRQRNSLISLGIPFAEFAKGSSDSKWKFQFVIIIFLLYFTPTFSHEPETVFIIRYSRTFESMLSLSDRYSMISFDIKYWIVLET